MLGSSKKDISSNYDFDENPARIAIVSATYFADSADSMVDRARSAITDVSATFEIHQVAGILDLAPALRILINSGDYNGYVLLGAVQSDDDAQMVIYSEGLRAVQSIASEGHCVGTSLICADTEKQIKKTANARRDNVAHSAVKACLDLIQLSRKVSGKTKGIGFKPASEHIIIAKRDDGQKIT